MLADRSEANASEAAEVTANAGYRMSVTTVLALIGAAQWTHLALK